MAGAGSSCGGRYPLGQCTAGGAAMFPAVCQSPNLGNGGDWYGNAASFGWPHQQGPVAGWLASFHVDPPFGDVGLIEAINGDGTVLRNGVNWHLDGNWSRDNVAIDLITGSFQPPGQFVAPPNYQGPTPAQTMAAVGGQGAGPAPGARGLRCQFAWQLPQIQLTPAIPIPGTGGTNPLNPAGTNPGVPTTLPQVTIPPLTIGGQPLCMDGLIGALAWVLGGLGFGLAAWLLVRGPVERAAGRAAQVAGEGVEVAGAVTAQPEVAAAGAGVSAAGGVVHEEGVRHTVHPIQQARALNERTMARRQQPQPPALQPQEEQLALPAPRTRGERTGGQRPSAGPGPIARGPGRRRSATTGLSVQEQETFRQLRQMGYSPVNARRGAQAAGSGGDREQRVRRGMRAIR